MLRNIEYTFGKNTAKINQFVKSQKEIINSFEIFYVVLTLVITVLASLPITTPHYHFYHYLFYIFAVLGIIISMIHLLIKQKIKINEPNAIDVIEGQQALIIINKLNKELTFASTLSVFASDAINDLKDEILSKYIIDPQKFRLRNHIKNMSILLYEAIDGTRLFGELFSIAVYIYDPNDNKLKDYYSYKNSVMKKKEGKGREWDIDDNGHVCITYRRKSITIQDNLHRNKETLFKPRNNKPKDEEYYISAIAIPLFFKNDKSKVRGIFCIASNIEERFGLEVGKKEDLFNKKITSIKRYSIQQIALTIGELLNTIDGSDNKIFLDEIRTLPE